MTEEEEDDESSVVSDDEPDPVVVFHCLELEKIDLLFIFFFPYLIISFYLEGVHGMATSLVTSG